MIRLAAVFALAISPIAANAQSLSDYLRLRSQYKITRAAEPTVLDDVHGSQIFELQGRVKGSFKVNNQVTLMFERADGKQQMVDTVGVSPWLLNGNVETRLIVRATKQQTFDPLRVTMIGAAPASDVARVEEVARRKAEAKRIAAEKAAQEKSTRTAAAKAPEPQLASSGLSGEITRNGTRLSSRSSSGRSTVGTGDAVQIYGRWIKGVNRRLTDAQALEIADCVIRFSLHYSVDPRLVMSILLAESGFDPNSVSRSGAMGLGQLMPSTAKWMGVSNPFDTQDNLGGSVKLLRHHLEKYYRQTGGDAFRTLIFSLAAYNAGEGAVRRHGGVPPYRETVAYVQKVRAIYEQLCSN